VDTQHGPIVQAEDPSRPVTVVQVPRTIEMYNVTSEELDGIGSASAALNFGMFTLCAGVLVSLIITLTTVHLETRPFAAYVAAAIAVAVLSIYFGSRSAVDWRERNARIRRITERRG
jgi:hypothetical protein